MNSKATTKTFSHLSPYQLNIRHLRGLISVRSLGSISAACDVMGLSQPALTQGILKLEAQIGEALFERRPDGMRCTLAGEILADRVQLCLEQLEHGAKLVSGEVLKPDRRMTMPHLRALLSVANTSSLAQAALDLGLSQTAVHRAVRELESTVGCKLVERRGRGVQVNMQGRRLARTFRLAVKELEAAFIELGIDPSNPIISVGTTPLVRAFLAPEGIATMMAESMPIGFRILEGSWTELVEHLRDGIIDLIVGEISNRDVPGLAQVQLYEQSPIVVCGRQHPLAGRKVVEEHELAKYPWIIGPVESPLRAQWERLFAHKQTQSPVECGSIMINGRLLTSSDALMMALPDQVALQVRSGLLSTVGTAMTMESLSLGLTLRQSWRPTTAQTRFIEVLRETALHKMQDFSTLNLVDAEWV